MRSGGLGPILIRVAAVIGGMLLVGLLMRLVLEILSPVLPPSFMDAIAAGWELLVGMVGPAVPAIFAVVILGAAVWVIIGRRR